MAEAKELRKKQLEKDRIKKLNQERVEEAERKQRDKEARERAKALAEKIEKGEKVKTPDEILKEKRAKQQELNYEKNKDKKYANDIAKKAAALSKHKIKEPTNEQKPVTEKVVKVLPIRKQQQPTSSSNNTLVVGGTFAILALLVYLFLQMAD